MFYNLLLRHVNLHWQPWLIDSWSLLPAVEFSLLPHQSYKFTSEVRIRWGWQSGSHRRSEDLGLFHWRQKTGPKETIFQVTVLSCSGSDLIGRQCDNELQQDREEGSLLVTLNPLAVQILQLCFCFHLLYRERAIIHNLTSICIMLNDLRLHLPMAQLVTDRLQI